MAEQTTCGISGVALDEIARISPTSTQVFGRVFTKPSKDAEAVSPYLATAETIRRPYSELLSGYIWTNPAGKKVVSIRGLGDSVFDSSEEAYRWLRRDARFEVYGRNMDIKTSGDHVLSFDSANAFGNAGDLRKAIAMFITRLVGNTGESRAYLNAVDQSLSDHQFGKMSSFLLRQGQEWRDAASFLSNLSHESLDRTLAGRWLNSANWLTEGLLNEAAVLERESISGELAAKTKNETGLSLSDRYYAADAIRRAANIGPDSPLSQMLALWNGKLRELNLKTEDVMRYRESLFHGERQKYIRTMLDSRLREEKDAFTEAALNDYLKTERERAKAAGEEFGTAAQDAAIERFRELRETNGLLDNFEERVGANVRARFRDENPIAFTYTAPDGTVHEGDNAVLAYHASLSPEQANNLAAMNQILSDGIDAAHYTALREGVMSMSQIMEIANLGSNYIPQRTNEVIRRIMPEAAPVGRFEKIKDPFRAITNYIDTVTRIANENLVRRQVVDDLKTFTSSPIWKLEEISNKIDLSARDRGYVVSYPAPRGETVGRRFRLTILPEAENTSAGKALKKLLGSEPSGQVMQFLSNYTKFSSIMYTTARPAWMLKSLAMNTCITPFALQSAMGLSAEDATKLLFGQRGEVGSFFVNALKEMGHRVKGAASRNSDEMTEAFHNAAARFGAASPEDPRYYTPDLLREARRSEGSILERFKDNRRRRQDDGQKLAPVRGGLDVAKDEAAHYFGKYQGIQHSPDEIFRVAAFRSMVEHEASRLGIPLKTAADLEDFIRNNENFILRATTGANKIMPQFSRRGNIRFLRSVFPFFNASLQTLPFMKQMAFSRYGATGFGAMMVLGYAGAQIARNEFGESGQDLKGSESSLYLGHGIAIPQDYAYGAPLRMGQAFEHLVNGNGHFDAVKETLGVADSLAKSFSPFDTPWEGQSTAGWLATHIMPPAISAPFLTAFHLDENGNEYINENPSDAQGHALANANGYEYGKSGDSVLSTQIAKGLEALTGGIIDAAPGTVTGAFRILAPGVEDTVNNILGERGGKYGDEDSGSLLSRFRHTFAPSFSAAPTFMDGRREFQDQMYDIIPKTGVSLQDLQKGLAGTPEQQHVANLHREIQSQAEKITIDTDEGPMTSAQIGHALIDAERNGQWDRMRGLRAAQYAIRNQINTLWHDGLNRINNND